MIGWLGVLHSVKFELIPISVHRYAWLFILVARFCFLFRFDLHTFSLLFFQIF